MIEPRELHNMQPTLDAALLQLLTRRGLYAEPAQTKATQGKTDIFHVFDLLQLVPSFVQRQDGQVSMNWVGALLVAPEQVKVGKNALVKWMTTHPQVDYILVILSDISTPALRAMAQEFSKKIEILKRTDLAWDKLQFRLVPHYAILSEHQIRTEEIRRKFKREDLPKMYTVDPVARLLGFRQGQVVWAMDYDTWRLVIQKDSEPISSTEAGENNTA